MDQEKDIPHPESTQSGPGLAGVREETGKTLRDISRVSRIRLLYLEAIEKENYSLLPEPIYAETFIRTYAREIGVQEEVILSRYRRFLKGASVPEQGAVKEKRTWIPKKSWEKEKEMIRSHLRVFGWIATALIAVGFLISFFVSYTDEPAKPEIVKAPVETAPPPAAETTPAPPVDPAAQAVAPVPGEAANPEEKVAPAPPEKTSYTLVVEASETTWLNIVEDDQPPYEIMLRSGERIEREAAERFVIDVGNAGGVDIRFQGKSLGRLGNSGQVVHLVLPESSGRN